MGKQVHDLHHNISVGSALNQATISTDTTTSGLIVDTAGYEGIEFILQSGTITDGAYAVTMKEGDNSALSDGAAVSAAETLGDADFALADDDEVKKIGSIGKKRYVNLQITSSATTSGGSFSAAYILYSAHHQPTAD